jgi:hypothetical protein
VNSSPLASLARDSQHTGGENQERWRREEEGKRWGNGRRKGENFGIR